MDDQEPQLSPDFQPETENPQPKSQKSINEKSSPLHNDQNHGHATKLENFKALLLRYALSSSPTKSLSPMQRSIIGQRLHDFFPDFHTPDHPPYAAMIETAIEKLNKEGGSTEAEISQFIRNEYPDLPGAHESLFKHHLENLCEDGSVVEAGNRFYMIGDVVTDHSPGSLCRPSHVVTHGPISSLASHTDAESSPSLSSCSSPSWCSSTSYSSSPSPKRKRPFTQRQKRGIKRGRQRKRTTKRKRIHVKRRGKRVKRSSKPRKKNLVEEDQVGLEKLMLEEEGKKSEGQNGRKEEHNEVVEGHNQDGRKRKRVKELGQRQETQPLKANDLDQSEGMIREEWREQQSQEKSVGRDDNQANVLERQKQDKAQYIEGQEEEDWPLQNHTEVFFKCELQQEAQVKVVGQEDHMEYGQREVGALVDTAKEDNQLIVEESFLKDTKFEVIGEQSPLEEREIEIVSGARKEQKKRDRPCKRTVRGRNVCQKSVPLPGRRRGRPRKKDFLIEQSQPNAEKLEANQTQEVMLEEKTEVIKENNEVNAKGAMGIEGINQVTGNGQETCGCSQLEETKTEIEIGKPALIAEENEFEDQHNIVMEGEPRLIGGNETSNEQREHEIVIDLGGYQSGNDKNDVYSDQNKPHRQQNEEQNQPVEKNIESSEQQEIEMDEMHDQNLQVQQKIQLEGEHDDTQTIIASKSTVLWTESSRPVYEEKKEKGSKKDVEWQKDIPIEKENTKICGEQAHVSPEFPASELSSKLRSVEMSPPPHYLQLPGPISEGEKEEMLKKNMEHQGENHGQEGNIEICYKPEYSSAESCSNLKSEGIPFQQESLQQPLQAQEKPQRLWHRFLRSFNLYGRL